MVKINYIELKPLISFGLFVNGTQYTTNLLVKHFKITFKYF